MNTTVAEYPLDEWKKVMNLNLNCDKSSKTKLSSLGVAYLAGLNAGLIKNVNAISTFWKKSKIAKPNTSKKIIQIKIKTWKKTVKNLISLNS